MTDAVAAHGPRTTALLARVDALETAVDRGGERLPEATRSSVRGALSAVRDRLALGVDHTVVALVGGTGSGKSTLFNALTGLPLADVGARRPTTSQPTACVWAHDATALLDWLGVARDRRTERETALDGESQADLRGLVLLDLPDHDSVEPEHRAVVDHLLPMVDVLVWVLDPQKYADDALHTGYLRGLVGREAAMLVVMNQIDTVPSPARDSLLADVDRLLRDDGLAGVGVHSASALTGEGLGEVRGLLARAVAGPSLAEVRAAAELDDAAARLAAAVGDREPAPSELPVDEAADGLADAAGLPGVLDALRSPGGRHAGGAADPLRLGPAQHDRVDVVRRRWVERVGGGLPASWRASLDDAVPPSDEVTRLLDERLTTLTIMPARVVAATVMRWIAALVGLAALVAVGVVAARWVRDGGADDPTVPLGVSAAVAALVAVGLLAGAVALRRRALARRADEVAAGARERIGTVVTELLVGPSSSVLADHRSVRETAALRSGAGTALG